MVRAKRNTDTMSSSNRYAILFNLESDGSCTASLLWISTCSIKYSSNSSGTFKVNQGKKRRITHDYEVFVGNSAVDDYSAMNLALRAMRDGMAKEMQREAVAPTKEECCMIQCKNWWQSLIDHRKICENTILFIPWGSLQLSQSLKHECLELIAFKLTRAYQISTFSMSSESTVISRLGPSGPRKYNLGWALR
jgi:hypothetical protein